MSPSINLVCAQFAVCMCLCVHMHMHRRRRLFGQAGKDYWAVERAVSQLFMKFSNRPTLLLCLCTIWPLVRWWGGHTHGPHPSMTCIWLYLEVLGVFICISCDRLTCHSQTHAHAQTHGYLSGVIGLPCRGGRVLVRQAEQYYIQLVSLLS